MGTLKHWDGSPLPFEIDTSADEALLKLPSAPVLPVRCQPLTDELLSSWLVRLAWLNAEKLHTFRRRFWPLAGTPWGHNIDLTIPEDALTNIAGMTLSSREFLFGKSLGQYVGRLFERVGPNGYAPGILAGRRQGRKLLGFGLQLCPECIQADSIAYFRRWWRVSYFVTCPVHKRLLLDACPKCGRALAYHLSDFGKSLLPERIPTSFCANCGHCWADTSSTMAEPFPDDFYTWQQKLLEALETGWFESRQSGFIYTLSYFVGLRVLIRLLAANGHCARLRQILAKEIGVLPLGVVHAGNRSLFDGLQIGDRLYLLRYAWWLLQDWPDRFVWAIKTARIAFSYISYYRKTSDIPYWVYSASVLGRDHRHSRISPEERESVKHFLRRHGFPISANQVNKWLGRWYVGSDVGSR